MALGGSYIDHAVRQYTDQILHELQQNGSLLNAAVTIDQAMGSDRRYFDKIGASQSQVRTGRFEKVDLQDQTYERRFVTPTAIVANHGIDQLDLDRYMRSPQSELAQSLAMRLGRDKDDIIMNAMLGAAGRELNGAVSNVNFDTTNQQIAVNSNGMAGSTMAGNTSLHEGKILQARQKLLSKYAYMQGEDVYVIGNSLQLSGLTSRVLSNPGAGFFQKSMPQVSSPTLDAGLDGFAGYHYICYEGIPQVSSNDVVYVMPKSAVKLGMWRDLSFTVAERNDLNDHPIQLSASMALGAVRMFEEKIVRILCNPTLTYA